MLLSFGSKILDLNKPWSCKYSRKRKNKQKVDMCDFSVHNYTKEQNSSLYFSSIVWQCR